MNVDFIFDKARWSMDSEGDWVSLRIPFADRRKAQQFVDAVDKPYTVEIKPYRKKRSLDANAYFWVLADKLATETGVPKIEVYRNVIRDIGGNNTTVCVPEAAEKKLRSGWEKNGIGWLTETMPSKLPGCVNVTLYYGSSTYDSVQMNRLISNIVQDCQAVGIETMTPQELSFLMETWDKGVSDIGK